ncbi:MAG: response regulator [Candidatus Kerfeldbacteria bacterium]|nr:response regulator [Candidatus Kerfeldbacteria bacterium]
MSPTPQRPVRILLIEDEAALLYALQSRLAVEGFHIVSAPTAEQAIRAVTTDVPDLVVSDIVLPGMDGLELLKTLRAQNGLGRVPAVIISNLPRAEAVRRGLPERVLFLHKQDFSLDALVREIVVYARR